jgi:hypothetical protein
VPGHPREGPVERQQVTLTSEADGMVAAWAALQGASFGGALESLARPGLVQAPRTPAPAYRGRRAGRRSAGRWAG